MTYVDFATLDRSKKRGNSYLIAPEDMPLGATKDAVAPKFRGTAEALFHNLVALLNSDDQFVEVKEDPVHSRVYAVAQTKLLKFKDDIDIQIIPTEAGGSTLAIYSRSRLGKSDFGVNKKRIEALLSKLHKEDVVAEGEGGLTMKAPGHSAV
ncbi:hypothetical protein PB2503_10379 [Parvularcula bermudensis HTCC2503]|uniref:DUF1499 domain-containing protein n=1 Tax=Parvularcula bermudensis (strain ATCC BAA-594 / HTCC2503 / KCTC 12087) TaxID=314260 RepID=E0TG08_PARBH|nr:DUF1499 domain-containing protein [Parvularcula bermudensis]ADM10127.1 hypothetical protein PB2503_10379 [Parvularcula bermudensis HTCC2503]